jgi:hypothetical protein
MRTAILALIPFFFAACGGSSDAGSQSNPQTGPSNGSDAGGTSPAADAGAPPADAAPDADNGAPSDTYPAFHPDYPQVITSGGPVLKTPKIVPILFPSYVYAQQIADYVAKLPQQAYWPANVSEYGVGALTAGSVIQLTESAPATISDTQIQQWLVNKLNGSDPLFGTADEQTIYTIFYPESTTITMGSGQFGGTSCQSFGGYHDDITINGKYIPYAVIPLCTNFHSLTPLDMVTGAASHEWIEAVTDPYPSDNPAFGGVDDNHAAFEFALGGGETGDMCAQYTTSFFKPTGFDYTVQRAWSNAAAKAGHDPCVPQLAGEAYFTSAPLLDDTLNLNLFGQKLTTKGVIIALNQSKTIEVDLLSDAKTSGAWTVSAKEPSTIGGTQPATLKFDWDRTSGVNGEKLHLTVTAIAASKYGVSPFVIVSSLGDQKSIWAGLVSNK